MPRQRRRSYCCKTLTNPCIYTPYGVAIFGLVWLSYALGALLGALGNAFLTYPLLLPAAVLPFVHAPFWQHLRR
jgi:hypothetical protein